MTRVLPLGINVRKLPLVNIRIITDILKLKEFLEIIKPNPLTLQMSELRPRLLNTKVWVETRVFPNMTKASTKKGSSLHFILYPNCYIFLEVSPPAPAPSQPQENVSLC